MTGDTAGGHRSLLTGADTADNAIWSARHSVGSSSPLLPGLKRKVVT